MTQYLLQNRQRLMLRALSQKGRQTLSQLLDRGLQRNAIQSAQKHGILLRTYDPVTNLYYYTVNLCLFDEVL